LAKTYRQLHAQPRWAKVRGPRGATIATFLDIGWKPIAPHIWLAPCGDRWEYKEGLGTLFYKEFSESIRTQLWGAASEYLWGAGLQDGVDLTVAEQEIASLAAGDKFEEKGMLITSLCAGCWPRTRLHEAGKIDDPSCPRCKQAPETLQHRYWECPANTDIESPAICESNRFRCDYSDAAQCFWLRGLVPKGWTTTGPLPQESLQQREGVFLGSKPFGGEYFTDGSGGLHTADPRLRRCGWAVVSATKSAQERAVLEGALWGTLSDWQTVPRAELYAVIMAVEHTNGPIQVYSDCKYVVDGYHRGKDSTIHGSNGDLWVRLWAACAARACGEVKLTKVKAHTSQADEDTGLITRFHREGNEYSDKYAGLGAQLNQVPQECIDRVHAVDLKAKWVIRRLLAINMACVKLYPNSKPVAVKQAAPAQAAKRPRIAQAWARARLAALGHKLLLVNTTLRCTVCKQSRPLKQAGLWVKGGRCPGPPAPTSASSQGMPAPPKSGAGPCTAQPFSRGVVHISHRTTLHKGLVMCWKCGAYSKARLRALARRCQPLKCTQARLARMRQGLPPTPGLVWPEP